MLRAEARFRDRAAAGDELARALGEYAGRDDVAVLGVARGGVAVAARVAAALGAPLDVVVVRKLGFPGQPELAVGALGPGGVRVMNPEALAQYRGPAEVIEATASREQAELERRELLYRSGRPPAGVRGRTVIIVDDGLATGSTVLAAVRSLRAQAPRAIVVAVPVSSTSALRTLAGVADRVLCLVASELFSSVGEWYGDFGQTTDSDVRTLLDGQGPLVRATKGPTAGAAPRAMP